MICRECGEEIKDGAKFCPFCGSVQDINADLKSDDKEEIIGSKIEEDEKNLNKEKLNKKDNYKKHKLSFKTSKSKKDDEKQKRKKNILNKLLSFLLVLMIVIAAATCIAFRVLEIRKTSALFKEAVYVKDGSLYFDKDISINSDDTYKISEADSVLFEYGLEDKIASFSKDKKTIYYLGKDTGDGSGRLCKIDTSKISSDETDTANNSVVIEDFVVDVDVVGDGVIFLTNENKCGYYNGKKTAWSVENVYKYYISDEDNFVYMLIGDENANAHTLVYKKISSKKDAEEISDNVSNLKILSENKILYTVMSSGMTTQYFDLYIKENTAEPVEIASKIYSFGNYNEDDESVFFTKENDDVLSLYIYFEGEAKLVADTVSNVSYVSQMAVFEQNDEIYYSINGDAYKMPDAGEYVNSQISEDGRYVLVEYISADEENTGNHIIYSYRASSGELSTQKEVTDNGALATSTDKYMYYISNDEDVLNLYSFYNERKNIVAKDIGDDFELIQIKSLGTGYVLVDGLIDTDISVYGKNAALLTEIEGGEIVYAGKNSLIYEKDDTYSLLTVQKNEYSEVEIVTECDALITAEKSDIDAYYINDVHTDEHTDEHTDDAE